MSQNAKVDRANAQFAKLQRAEDGKKATSEYEAERIATLAKTERLKEARLARDLAQQGKASDQPPVAAAKPAKKKKTKAKTLSTWLNDQNGGGRRS